MLTRALVEGVATLVTLVVARYLIGLSTPAQDWSWVTRYMPDFGSLAFYRFPEIVHQWRGWQILRHL